MKNTKMHIKSVVTQDAERKNSLLYRKTEKKKGKKE